MNLYSYLKRFKNIAWYPSAHRDGTAMACLSFNSLAYFGIKKEEAPNCFIYTDYASYSDYNSSQRFVLDLYENENQAVFFENEEMKVTAFNVKEIQSLHIGFNQDMVAFEKDSKYYGRVFLADILVEHKELGKLITKLVYVFSENTEFAFHFLLRHHIKVTYAIHSCYGHGFGGGISSGAYMFHVLKDLGVRYFASDMREWYNNDVADCYLSMKQKNEIPVMAEICNFSTGLSWVGYDDTKLYKIIDFAPFDSSEGAERYLLQETRY